MSKNFLSRDCELRNGDYLMSNNGQWKAIFQDDSNFVVYGWKPVWGSDTHGVNAVRLCMQADCNLVMYDEAGTPKWSTSTGIKENKMCRLQLTDDGKLVVYRDATMIWSS